MSCPYRFIRCQTWLSAGMDKTNQPGQGTHSQQYRGRCTHLCGLRMAQSTGPGRVRGAGVGSGHSTDLQDSPGRMNKTCQKVKGRGVPFGRPERSQPGWKLIPDFWSYVHWLLSWSCALLFLLPLLISSSLILILRIKSASNFRNEQFLLLPCSTLGVSPMEMFWLWWKCWWHPESLSAVPAGLSGSPGLIQKPLKLQAPAFLNSFSRQQPRQQFRFSDSGSTAQTVNGFHFFWG